MSSIVIGSEKEICEIKGNECIARYKEHEEIIGEHREVTVNGATGEIVSSYNVYDVVTIREYL